MIASDRTDDGERRRGPVACGSSASKNLKSKARVFSRRGSTGGGGVVSTPVARWSSGSEDRPSVGGGLDRRTTGVRHLGGGDLHDSTGQRPRLAVRRDQEDAAAGLAVASRSDGAEGAD